MVKVTKLTGHQATALQAVADGWLGGKPLARIDVTNTTATFYCSAEDAVRLVLEAVEHSRRANRPTGERHALHSVKRKLMAQIDPADDAERRYREAAAELAEACAAANSRVLVLVAQLWEAAERRELSPGSDSKAGMRETIDVAANLNAAGTYIDTAAQQLHAIAEGK